jgi:hypothetical protein
MGRNDEHFIMWFLATWTSSKEEIFLDSCYWLKTRGQRFELVSQILKAGLEFFWWYF